MRSMRARIPARLRARPHLLAEFGYGGKRLPSFPAWLIDGTKPSRFAWLLKERTLPFVCWQGMLKGREWLVTPKLAD